MNEKKKQKVFIVEDDGDLAEMLTAYFKVQGYDVAHAARGEDAVGQIDDFMPDIALLDIRLPDIDGYEVCRRLRESRRTHDLPVIFLTEKRERDDKLSGLELGAVDYITKPFDIQELRLRVRNVLRRASLNTLVNPVTGLPEGHLVREQLDKMLHLPEWGLVLIGIRGLSKFRDRFGFVAADDVSRAITLMITNAMKETGGEDDYIGHATGDDFAIITSADKCARLADRCLIRLQPSIQYFYPALERHRIHEMPESERLNVYVSSFSSRDYNFTNVNDLFATLEGD
ncbi:MAG: response regulator [Ardenticatenaceae bacterium]|nr:response regulator [Ardenticatenaceae bacterium]